MDIRRMPNISFRFLVVVVVGWWVDILYSFFLLSVIVYVRLNLQNLTDLVSPVLL
jgi:hypothetical protein